MRQGDIYFVHLPCCMGSVEGGYRPVVIVSSNRGIDTSNAIMVCPITSQRKQLSCNVDIDWSTDNNLKSQVLCNQIMTIPKYELLSASRVGCVTIKELQRIAIAMLISLDIKTNYDEVRI